MSEHELRRAFKARLEARHTILHSPVPFSQSTRWVRRARSKIQNPSKLILSILNRRMSMNRRYVTTTYGSQLQSKLINHLYKNVDLVFFENPEESEIQAFRQQWIKSDAIAPDYKKFPDGQIPDSSPKDTKRGKVFVNPQKCRVNTAEIIVIEGSYYGFTIPPQLTIPSSGGSGSMPCHSNRISCSHIYILRTGPSIAQKNKAEIAAKQSSEGSMDTDQ